MYSEKATENNGHNSTLQIKQDDKFFCRLLSKETSISNNPSFRVTPVTVPFLWESHPGTPKHPFSELSPPPLTPPPSYFYNTTKPISNNPIKKKTSRSNLFHFSFSRFNLRKTLLLTSSLSSSRSSSSSSSSSSSLDSSRAVGSNGRRRRRFSSCDYSVDLWGNSNCDEEEHDAAAAVADSRRNPSSCFGFRRSNSSNGGFGGC